MADTSLKCDGCLNKIEDEVFLKCFNCHKQYDLICANVPEDQFRSMGSAHKSTFKCVLCKAVEPKYYNTDTPLRGGNDNITMHRGSRTLNPATPCELAETSSIMEVSYMEQRDNMTTPPNNYTKLANTLDVSRTTEMQMLVTELRLFREEMRAMTLQLHELRVTMAALTVRIDGCDGHIERLSARVQDLESRAEACHGQQPENTLSETIAHLRAELNDRDQDQLLNDVEISCVPEQQGENSVHVALTVSQKLGLNVTEHDIVDATRVGRALQAPGEGVQGAPSRPRLLVVRLARRAVRDQLLLAARARRGATTEGTSRPGPVSRFYVNERLTPHNRRLFYKARELKQQFGWRFAWTRDGKVFVRQRPGTDSPRQRIRTELDLDRVFGQRVV